MQLFDLNIPYLESDKSISDKSSKKQTRLKLIVKAMELGYSGIAYNRTIKGAMSESDRCTISPFPLSSLLSHSPSLAATVSFHRRLLKVPQKGAFRQYTRLTMFVETSAQASALNSGNLILKTYDLIAVTPLNQTCFDIACQSSQVDLISIDFGDKLPFRLKLPMVKAALARGVYFEIMYSSLLQDVQLRRQMISNAKLLVEWTRGKNLIVSSAASSTLELRGPNDVANLLSLLGLSNECAKATISKNCRLLISNTLRQKQFYKEAIRVEKMPSGVQTDPKEPWIVDHLDWDPLSIGEGDLLLDDMAKAFSESGKISRVAKSIVSSSIVDPVQSHGVQVDDIGFRTQGKLGMFSNFISISSSKDLEVSKMTEKTQNGPTSLCSSLLDQSENAIEDSQQVIHSDSPMVCTNVEDSSIHSSVSVLEKSYDVLETTTTLDHISNVDNVLLSDGMKEVTSTDDGLDLGYIVGSRKEFLSKYEGFDCGGAQTDSLKLASGSLNRTEAGVSTELEFHDQSDLSLCPDISFSGNLLKLKEDPFLHGKNLMDLDSVIDRNSSALLLGDQQSLESVVETKEKKEDETEVKLEIKESLVLNSVMSFDPLQQEKDVNDLLISKSMLSDDHGMMECIKQVLEIGEAEYKSLSPKNLGNHNVKRQYRGQIPRFPFKRLLQVQFKKKGRASMYKTKKRE